MKHSARYLSGGRIFISFLAGILTAELISFIEVYLSNHNLADTVKILTQAGYTVVPSGKALLPFFDIFPAFAGASFFSCTAGSVITVSAIICFAICYYFFKKAKRRIFIFCSIWTIITIVLLFTGESLTTMAYTLSIPLTIICILEGKRLQLSTGNKNISEKNKEKNKEKIKDKIEDKIEDKIGDKIGDKIKNKSKTSKNSDSFYQSIHEGNHCTWNGILIIFISMLLTASIYYSRCDKGIFLRARDYLLVTNKLGRALNDFYYNYTLYAAEVIKTPLQKQVKTCWIHPETSGFSKLRETLSRYGWLNIDLKEKASLILTPLSSIIPPIPLKSLTASTTSLVSPTPLTPLTPLAPAPGQQRIILLKNSLNLLSSVPSVRGFFFHEALEVDLHDFLKKPFYFLNQFSQISDIYKVMRMLCFIGLIALTPLLLYLACFSLIACCLHIIFSRIPCKSCNSESDLPWQRSITAFRLLLTITAAITVLLFSALLNTLYPFSTAKGKMVTKNMLANPDSRIRTEALRNICNDQKEHIWNYPYEQSTLMKSILLKSTSIESTSIESTSMNSTLINGNIAEKYWLAKALGRAGKQKGIPYLEILSNDHSINVQCSAIEALSYIGKSIPTAKQKYVPHSKQAANISKIFTILGKKITHTHQWYVQLYAYKALKKIKIRHNNNS